MNFYAQSRNWSEFTKVKIIRISKTPNNEKRHLVLFQIENSFGQLNEMMNGHLEIKQMTVIEQSTQLVIGCSKEYKEE